MLRFLWLWLRHPVESTRFARGMDDIAIVIDGKAWNGDDKDLPGWEEFEKMDPGPRG